MKLAFFIALPCMVDDACGNVYLYDIGLKRRSWRVERKSKPWCKNEISHHID